MKIISWNVNGIKKRLNDVKELIEQQNPDIICIQEVKTSDIPEIENSHFMVILHLKRVNMEQLSIQRSKHSPSGKVLAIRSLTLKEE